MISVIKHFYGLRTVGYNYINEYYWKQLLSYDMLPVLNKRDNGEIQRLVEDLYGVFFKLLHNAQARPDVYFVELKNIDQFALTLGDRIGVKPDFNNAVKRAAKYELDFQISFIPEMDEKYTHFLKNLPGNRFFPLDSTPIKVGSK